MDPAGGHLDAYDPVTGKKFWSYPSKYPLLASQLSTAGDLVFFRTYRPGPSHVGIYIGGGRFVHVSYTRGVIISSIEDPYFNGRFIGARRI